MKVKIKKLTLVHIVLVAFVLMILLDYKLFGIINYSGVFQGYKLNVVTVCVGLIFVIICSHKIDKNFKEEKNWIIKIAAFSFLYWLIIFGYSTIKYYKQPIIVTLAEHICLLYIFWTIPLLFIMCKKNPDIIFRCINLIAFIWYVLLLIQFFKWNDSKSIIFNEYISSSIRIRDYGIRLGLGSVGNVAILYNIYLYFNENKRKYKKIFYLLLIILGGFCMMFVQQTRSTTVIVFLCIVYQLLYGIEQKNKKYGIKIALFIIFMYIIFSGFLVEFVKGFSYSSSDGIGTQIRVNAISYYIDCFRKSPLFGNGFTNYKYYPNVQYGSLKNGIHFYYSDVGIFGLLGETGLGSIIFYLIPLVRLILIAKKAFIVDRIRYSFFISCIIYMFLTSFSLIITDSFRIILYPIIIAYGLWVSSEIKRKGCNN